MGITGMIFSTTVLVIVFGFALSVRYLQYRETLALAERGLVAPPSGNGDGRGTLRWGVILTFVGLAVSCSVYPLGWSLAGGSDFPLRFGPWMLLGLLPLACGLALLFVYVIVGRPDDSVAGSPTGFSARPDAPQASTGGGTDVHGPREDDGTSALSPESPSS